MDETLAWMGWLAALVALVFGLWLGGTAVDQSWEKDCVAMGAHRGDKAVFTCSKRKD
jgi:hypothetical protein